MEALKAEQFEAVKVVDEKVEALSTFSSTTFLASNCCAFRASICSALSVSISSAFSACVRRPPRSQRWPTGRSHSPRDRPRSLARRLSPLPRPALLASALPNRLPLGPRRLVQCRPLVFFPNE
eukprot:GHVT01097960.1.p2 GENE.GHVT01097960.1~~GHVT01097960.1.p2  ORF type:complete len:123 (+),score=21.44 GHVT01097960.1:45-413(+)